MRVLVTGRQGQIAAALAESAATRGITLVTCGRPELDLERPETVAPAIRALNPDIVVNAAAWTQVDAAEKEAARATLANADAAREAAVAARALGCPIIQLSTDYVFAGDLDRPYREDDRTGPTGVYGASKLRGEMAVAATTPDHVILRTSWVHAAAGQNFVRTMVRLAATRDEVGVVDDQRGVPTYAPHIAAAVLDIAARLLREPDDAGLRGMFHLASSGPTASWADVADAVFAGLARHGGKAMTVRRITTAEYPTAARRPANSRLDCAKLARVHGLTLPDWREGVEACVTRILAAPVG